MNDKHEGTILQKSADKQTGLREHILSQPDKYKGKPWELVATIEDYANKCRLPMIFRGSKIATSKQALQKMDYKPKVFVEFGTFVGTSAIAWAALLRDFHGPDAKDLKVFTFEFDPSAANVARDLIKAAGVDDVVEVLTGPGAESLKKLHSEGRVKEGEVDVVFIDHWEQCYLPDLKLCEELKLFHIGSLAIADNTDMPGAPDYLAYVKKGGEGPVRFESESLLSEETGHHGPVSTSSKDGRESNGQVLTSVAEYSGGEQSCGNLKCPETGRDSGELGYLCEHSDIDIWISERWGGGRTG